MPRQARHAPGGYVYHIINRAVARLPLLQKDTDYEAFLNVIDEARTKHPIRILSYCLMPNHWHLVLWPRANESLTPFMRWLTHTHTMRWHAHYKTTGSGHLYQGRFKAFPVQDDDHMYTVLRYVERNPLRANLVKRAEKWRWSSLHERLHANANETRLAPGPLPLPADWLERVNRPETAAELEALRKSVNRGTPYGSEQWQRRIVKKLSLESTIRPVGRPKKK